MNHLLSCCRGYLFRQIQRNALLRLKWITSHCVGRAHLAERCDKDEKAECQKDPKISHDHSRLLLWRLIDRTEEGPLQCLLHHEVQNSRENSNSFTEIRKYVTLIAPYFCRSYADPSNSNRKVDQSLVSNRTGQDGQTE